MSEVSGVVITKNSENIIVDCLESLSFCDEIIVVDGGSWDRTVEIAKRMNAKIVKVQTDDFSQMRNIGMKKARNKWILYVDSDERVDSKLAEYIKNEVTKTKPDSFSAYVLRRKNYYLGSFEWPYIEKLERLFRKSDLKGWTGKLHETPLFEGLTKELDGFLLHYTHGNLTDMLEKTIEWSKVEAQLRYESNHPKMTWWRFPRVMITAFFDSYIKKRGYRAGTVGIIESVYQSFSMFITYMRLWELQRKLKISNEK